MLVLAAGLGALGWAVKGRLDARTDTAAPRRSTGPAPVEVAPVEQGEIKLRRTLSGTLEAWAEFVVSPKVGGRVESLSVDVADEVHRGTVVATLDDDEYEQAVLQAKAEQAVADANVAQALSAYLTATKELTRVQTLSAQGVASESQLEAAQAEHFAKDAALTVATAQAQRAAAAVKTTEIRQAYTQVEASWGPPLKPKADPPLTGQGAQDGAATSGAEEFGVPDPSANGDPAAQTQPDAPDADKVRIVAERYVDEGDTVSANTPLLSIVRLDPIKGVVFATEKDYANLSPQQQVSLTTDAFPGRTFTGGISRIAPIFRQASRQARVELAIENGGHELKPGMFVRANIILRTVENARIVPLDALVTRDGETGIFLVNESEKTVSWKPVTIGIRDGDRVQVIGDAIEGRVVTLGQQLLGDGAKITIPADEAKAPQPTPDKTARPEEPS